MTVRLSVAIQHHPARAALIPPLLEGLEGLDVQVIKDPGGSKPDTWRTHRACLEAMPEKASHLLVIQDDALLCDRFAERLCGAVEAHPEAMLAAFAPAFPFVVRHAEKARRAGEGSAVFPHAAFVPLVAMVYPRAHVEGLLAYTEGTRWPRARQMGTADDAIVAWYVRSGRIPVLMTVPSLVQHRDELASIAKPSHKPREHRRAALFAGVGDDL